MVFRKFFSQMKLKKFVCDKSCFQNFQKFKTLVWDTVANDTIKVSCLKIYLNDSTDIEYICSILRLCSNECILNEVFSIQLIKQDIHLLMFEKAFNEKSSWFLYSTLWNIFRFETPRFMVKNSFVKTILIDLVNVLDTNDPRLYNVYFGCLSNLSIGNKFKNDIHNTIVKLQSKDLLKMMSYCKNCDQLFETLCGLITNIGVNNDLCVDLLNSDFFDYLFSSLKRVFKENDQIKLKLIRNFLSMLNNFINHDKIIRKIIKHNVFDILLKIENELVVNQQLFNHVDNMFTNIKNHLFVNLEFFHYCNITNLHLANSFGYIDLILYKTLFENVDINVTDQLGNTILHNALIDNKLEFAKYYILFNADINMSNYLLQTPNDINKVFIEKILKQKNKINMLYINKINKNFKHHNISKYEKFIANEISEYIDIRKDIFRYSQTMTIVP